MKALEFLKNAKLDTPVKWVELDEAIAELEALENRSCDNCKFKYVVDSMTTECQHNDSPIDYVDLDCFPTFSCNVWESK